MGRKQEKETSLLFVRLCTWRGGAFPTMEVKSLKQALILGLLQKKNEDH